MAEDIRRFAIYLAAAVDMSKTDAFTEMAKRLAPALCFNPRGAFLNALDGQKDDFVIGMNCQAILDADMMVVYWDGSPSFGVPMELLYAAYFGKPVIMITPDGKPPKAIYGRAFVNFVLSMEDLTLDNVVAACGSFTDENDARQEIIKKIFKIG